MASSTPLGHSCCPYPCLSSSPQSHSSWRSSRRLLLVLVAVSAHVAQVHSQVPQPLFVFGDSVVDAGNNNFLPTYLKANFPPYGIDFVPGSGRYSNGRIIPDFIAEYLGIPYPPPILQPGGNFSLGANFASGGAGILQSTNPDLVLPLPRQLALFKTFSSLYSLSPLLERGIFLVHVGGNDLLNLPPGKSLSESLEALGNGYSQFIKDLYSSGARRIVLLSVPPIGCTPLVRAVVGRGLVPPSSGPAPGENGTQAQGGVCYSAANELSVALNGVLSKVVDSVQRNLSQAKIVRFDMYLSTLRVLGNLQRYGFSSVNACCGAPPPVNGLVSCGTQQFVGDRLVTSSLCGDRSRFVFWDGVHPTEHSHRVLADWIWNGGPFSRPSKGAQTLRV